MCAVHKNLQQQARMCIIITFALLNLRNFASIPQNTEPCIEPVISASPSLHSLENENTMCLLDHKVNWPVYIFNWNLYINLARREPYRECPPAMRFDRFCTLTHVYVLIYVVCLQKLEVCCSAAENEQVTSGSSRKEWPYSIKARKRTATSSEKWRAHEVCSWNTGF